MSLDGSTTRNVLKPAYRLPIAAYKDYSDELAKVEADFTIICHIHNMKEHWDKSNRSSSQLNKELQSRLYSLAVPVAQSIALS